MLSKKRVLTASLMVLSLAGCGNDGEVGAVGQREGDGGIVEWFVDCDGDGYAPTTEGSVTGAGRPLPVGACGWTATAPSDVRTTDCDDAEPRRSPGVVEFGLAVVSGPNLPAAGDLDCDSVEEADAKSVMLFDDEQGHALPLCGDGVACPCLSAPLDFEELHCNLGYPGTVRLADSTGACRPAEAMTVATLCL